MVFNIITAIIKVRSSTICVSRTPQSMLCLLQATRSLSFSPPFLWICWIYFLVVIMFFPKCRERCSGSGVDAAALGRRESPRLNAATTAACNQSRASARANRIIRHAPQPSASFGLPHKPNFKTHSLLHSKNKKKYDFCAFYFFFKLFCCRTLQHFVLYFFVK